VIGHREEAEHERLCMRSKEDDLRKGDCAGLVVGEDAGRALVADICTFSSLHELPDHGEQRGPESCDDLPRRGWGVVRNVENPPIPNLWRPSRHSTSTERGYRVGTTERYVEFWNIIARVQPAAPSGVKS
jgi:hypothetical protein